MLLHRVTASVLRRGKLLSYSTQTPQQADEKIPWHEKRSKCPRLIEYKKNAHKRPLGSPFSPIEVASESVAESMLRFARQHSEKDPKRKAFIDSSDDTHSMTFSDVVSEAASLQTFLQTHVGFVPGDVAVYVTGNVIEFAPMCLGIMAAGGIASGSNPSFTKGELARHFQDCRPKVVFTSERYLTKVMAVAANCDFIKKIVCMRLPSANAHHLPESVFEWREILRFQPALKPEDVKPDDIALLPYSSGTTGAPKGVLLSHRAVGTMAMMLARHYEKEVAPIFGPEFAFEKDNFIQSLPVYHVYGCLVCFKQLVCGNTGIISDGFNPSHFLKMIEAYRPNNLLTVPPVMLFLAKHPLVGKFDLSSIQHVVSSAAPAGPDLCEAFLARFPHVKYLGQAYGLSENTAAITMPLYENTKDFHHVGYPSFGNEIRTVNPESLEDVAPGERGEVWVRGPYVMEGYLNRPDETAEAITKDKWLRTGDIGVIDGEGALKIVDRLKELIKVKGNQVAPAEIEDLLISHPSIEDAAVIGIQDERMGELIRAYIVRRNKELKKKDVIDFVAKNLAAFKLLTGGVRFVESIPKSAAGKILRQELRDLVLGEIKK